MLLFTSEPAVTLYYLQKGKAVDYNRSLQKTLSMQICISSLYVYYYSYLIL